MNNPSIHARDMGLWRDLCIAALSENPAVLHAVEQLRAVVGLAESENYADCVVGSVIVNYVVIENGKPRRRQRLFRARDGE